MVNRKSIVIFFQGNRVVNKLKELENMINLVYVSKKQRYAVFYCNSTEVDKIMKDLKQTKGFRGYDLSPIFNEELNITLVKENNLTRQE